jgi:hypothetical protein
MTKPNSDTATERSHEHRTTEYENCTSHERTMNPCMFTNLEERTNEKEEHQQHPKHIRLSGNASSCEANNIKPSCEANNIKPSCEANNIKPSCEAQNINNAKRRKAAKLRISTQLTRETAMLHTTLRAKAPPRQKVIQRKLIAPRAALAPTTHTSTTTNATLAHTLDARHNFLSQSVSA